MTTLGKKGMRCVCGRAFYVTRSGSYRKHTLCPACTAGQARATGAPANGTRAEIEQLREERLALALMDTRAPETNMAAALKLIEEWQRG